MRTIKSAAELRRLALRTGAEVEIDGRPFNAARAVVALQPSPSSVPAAAPEPAAAAPALPPEPAQTLTQAQVEQMLAAHNARITEQITSIIAALKQAPQNPPGAAVREWDFHVEYDSHHAITNVNAKARP